MINYSNSCGSGEILTIDRSMEPMDPMFLCDERNESYHSPEYLVSLKAWVPKKRTQLSGSKNWWIKVQAVFLWLVKNTKRKFNTEPETTFDKNGYSEFRMLLLQHKNHLPKAITWEFHFSFLVNGSPLVVSWPMFLSWLDYCMLMKRRKSMVLQQTSEWYWNHETVWPTDYKSRASSSQKTSWMWFVPIVTA